MANLITLGLGADPNKTPPTPASGSMIIGTPESIPVSNIVDTITLQSVTYIGPNTIKVTYSTPPLQVISTGANDALNPNNYVLSGAAAVSCISVVSIDGDPTSFYLTTNNSLVSTTPWTLTINNVQRVFGTTLTNNTAQFLATAARTLPSVANGAQNTSPSAVLRKHLSPALSGKIWHAFTEALGVTFNYLQDITNLAFNQLYISTASGSYLAQRVADVGITKNSGLGFSDDVFRRLAIAVNAEKLTLQSFLEVLDVYYGDDALRANITSASEPYALQDQDTLLLNIDNKDIAVIFKTADFTNITSATAIEVAAVINRYIELNGLNAFAAVYHDIPTDSNAVKIYSGALGLRGSITVNGGRPQNILLFPTSIATTQKTGTQWKVDIISSDTTVPPNVTRYTYLSGANPSLQLLHIGDYVNIYGTVFNVANRGTFSIVNVTSTYFDVDNLGFPQATVTQAATVDITFFRPTKFTVNNNLRASFAAWGSPKETDVILAATTQAVSRQPFNAAYLHNNTALTLKNKLACTSLTRNANVVTVVTPTSHGLNPGDVFYLGPGEPQINAQFMPGVHTVASTPDSLTFTYSETGPGVATSTQQYIYYCYRTSDGTVTLKTTTNHGLSTGQLINTDNLVPDINSSPKSYFSLAETTGFSNTYDLDWRGNVQLSNGSIVMTGGATVTPTDQSLVEMYVPSSQTWTALANLNTARSKHTATLLNNGRILVTGGGAGITNCEIYDVTQNVWISTASMNHGRAGHFAVKLADGTVLVAGGGSAVAEIYDPVAETWTVKASMSVDRSFAQAILLPSNQIVVIGGYTTYPTALSSVETYNPWNDTWYTKASMSTARFYHKALFIPQIGVDGTILVTGGTTNDASSLSSIELFDINKNTWSAGAAAAVPRRLHAMVALSNGTIFYHGGKDNSGSPDDSFGIYNPIFNSWNNTNTNQSLGAVDQDAFLLSDGTVFSTPALSGRPTLFIPQVTPSSAGGLNGQFAITVVNSTTLTYTTTNSNSFKNATSIITDNASVTPVKAVSDSNHIGPYVYDTAGQSPVITGVSTTTTQTLLAGQSYSTLTVTDASKFPSEGYLVFAFGTANQTFPVKYTFKVSSNELLLDPSFIFPYTLLSGTQIISLKQRGIWTPIDPTTAGSFYLTDSISARESASSTIDSIAASGVKINKTILYPGDLGLGGAGLSVNLQSNSTKLPDKIYIWGSDADVQAIRGF